MWIAAWASDPNAVHETLTLLILAVFLVTFPIAMLYLLTLGNFFHELKVKEPEIWKRIGSPNMLGMVMIPVPRNERYVAFYPVLRQRAKTQTPRYRHARSSYMLLKVGLDAVSLLFILAAISIVWIILHDL